MYDPFMGTGSMAYVRIYLLPASLIRTHTGLPSHLQPTAHFGSLMFGSDIDGRQMRGKRTTTDPQTWVVLTRIRFLESEPGVFRAAKQYGVDGRILDLATFDMTNHPWRCGGFFDAIITDPPCEWRKLRCSRFDEVSSARRRRASRR